MTLLTVTNLSKQLGGVKILENINVRVKKGEFLTILGPSGSGKSTFFQLIGSLMLPDSGSIYLGNEKINGKRGYISYMPQTPSLLPWRTVMGNVLLGQELKGKKDKQLAAEMLERAGLGAYKDAYPHELSGGMKQRAAFIRALLSPQSVICLDEPFSALDEFTRLHMQKWLLSIWEEYKKTIIFVTHNIEEALFLSDRIIVFSERPATVKAEFKLPFPRPRKENILFDEQFLAIKQKIFREISGGR